MFWVVSFVVLVQLVHAQNSDRMLSSNQIMMNMSKHASPMTRPDDGGAAVNVTIDIYIMKVHSVSEEAMDLTVDMYLRRRWSDSRLSYDAARAPPSIIINPTAASKFLWIPDIFIPNSKSSVLHETSMQPDSGVRVTAGGEVLLSSRHSFTLHCFMDLKAFPFDKQECQMHIESYMFSEADMNLTWYNDNAVQLDPQINPVAFVVDGAETKTTRAVTSTATYLRLTTILYLRRLPAHYVAMVIVPMVIVLTLTSIMFWLPLAALREKSMFGGFLFLSMLLLAVMTQIHVPQVGYLKKLDVWVLFCLVWQSMALLYTLILSLAKIHYSSNNHKDNMEMDQMPDEGSSRLDTTNLTTSKPLFRFQAGLQKLDYSLRLAFPCGFILFALFFFLI